MSENYDFFYFSFNLYIEEYFFKKAWSVFFIFILFSPSDIRFSPKFPVNQLIKKTGLAVSNRLARIFWPKLF
jgi:hypothetical protein